MFKLCKVFIVVAIGFPVAANADRKRVTFIATAVRKDACNGRGATPYPLKIKQPPSTPKPRADVDPATQPLDELIVTGHEQCDRDMTPTRRTEVAHRHLQ